MNKMARHDERWFLRDKIGFIDEERRKLMGNELELQIYINQCIGKMVPEFCGLLSGGDLPCHGDDAGSNADGDANFSSVVKVAHRAVFVFGGAADER